MDTDMEGLVLIAWVGVMLCWYMNILAGCTVQCCFLFVADECSLGQFSINTLMSEFGYLI